MEFYTKNVILVILVAMKWVIAVELYRTSKDYSSKHSEFAWCAFGWILLGISILSFVKGL